MTDNELAMLDFVCALISWKINNQETASGLLCLKKWLPPAKQSSLSPTDPEGTLAHTWQHQARTFQILTHCSISHGSVSSHWPVLTNYLLTRFWSNSSQATFPYSGFWTWVQPWVLELWLWTLRTMVKDKWPSRSNIPWSKVHLCLSIAIIPLSVPDSSSLQAPSL